MYYEVKKIVVIMPIKLYSSEDKHRSLFTVFQENTTNPSFLSIDILPFRDRILIKCSSG